VRRPSLPVRIALFDITMMTFGGEARQRTEEEYNELVAATGFVPARGTGNRDRLQSFESNTALAVSDAKAC
jgi:hypothetical protein